MRKGDIYETKQGYAIEILEYRRAVEVVIQFKDSFEHILTVDKYRILRGNVKNPFHPTLFGVGVMGVGKYKSLDGKATSRQYKTWSNMLERCYTEIRQDKQPQYRGCTVDPRWHNLQVFAAWYDSQYKEDGWHIDKDLLSPGNEVYSPENCCVVPAEINKAIIRHKNGEYLPGVTRVKGRFKSGITLYGKYKYLGYFDTEEEAYEAHCEEKYKYLASLVEKYSDKLMPQIKQAILRWEVTPT